MLETLDISFSDEELDLDYLVFSLPNFRKRIFEVAKIFQKYGFNSRIFDYDTGKYSTILYNKTSNHLITFQLENEPWNKDNLFLHFQASNSRRIYSLIKKGIFSISQLNCYRFNVNRIDIQYVRPNEDYDTNLMDFFKESKRTFQTNFKGQPAYIDKRDKSLILGDRDSSYFLRIYSIQPNSALKFELEIKKGAAKKLGLFLQRSLFTEFESMVSRKYLNHLKKSVCLQTCFTHWLLNSLRIKLQKPETHLVSSYLRKQLLTQTNSEECQFYRLLQFISFIRSYLELGEEQTLNGQIYIIFEFKLVDFMKTLGVDSSSYQREKFLKFFDDLMKLPSYSLQFSDLKFRKLLFFPVVNAIQYTKNGRWHIQIAVAEPLIKGSYPFSFPSSFFVYNNTIDRQVKLSIIRAFAAESSCQKTYLIRSFLKNYKNRSYSTNSEVREHILEQLNQLVKAKTIQPRFQVSVNGNNFITKKNLQLRDIDTGEIILFYEVINSI